MISRTTFKQMILNQRELDQKIAEKMAIENLPLGRVRLAYKIEVAECINELKGIIKYWSVKDANAETFLEEFVDALHFALSYTYRYADKQHEHFMYKESETRIDYMYRSLMDDIADVKQCHGEISNGPGFQDEIAERALNAIESGSVYRSLAHLMQIVEWMGLTERDILDAYHKKLEINHGRSDSGTY